jgi:hypothetical protein
MNLHTRISEELLPSVRQPAQYIGGEINQLAAPGDWERADVRVASAFPDTYTIGMSHLGCQILYWICNHVDGVCAERVYSPWTDGTVNGLGSGSGGTNATTGHATILGDDPVRLVVTNQGVFKSSPRPYEGRYPCGSLVHNGVWFYGTYCLHPSGGVRRDDGILYNWPWMGPFVGFRWSTDFGKIWTQTPCTPEKPLFGERALRRLKSPNAHSRLRASR